MKIGIDLHGTLDMDFKSLGKLIFLMKDGTLNKKAEYIIISGSKNVKSLEKELLKINVRKGIHYKETISVVEFLIDQGTEFTYDQAGQPWCHDDIWWMSKAIICERNNIFLMIDDMPQYGTYFKKNQNFMLYKDFVKRFY